MLISPDSWLQPARGFRSSGIAVKMIEHSNPQTLPQAMAWVADISERSDALSRLGLRQVNDMEEMPMEVAALPPTNYPPSPQETDTQMLGKVLPSQDKIITKISNYNDRNNCYDSYYPFHEIDLLL